VTWYAPPVIPVAVLMFVKENTPVRTTGAKKNKVTKIRAGARKRIPSRADTLMTSRPVNL
jgi:hypothetical protein